MQEGDEQQKLPDTAHENSNHVSRDKTLCEQRIPRMKHKKRKRKEKKFTSIRSSGDPFIVDQKSCELTGDKCGSGSFLGYPSSSSSSVSRDASDEDSEEEYLGNLRKPKVYFSSRTHTQLQQVTDELRRTVFIKNLVRNRSQYRSGNDSTNQHGSEGLEKIGDSEPRKLRFVHVAGRQQLCLNQSVRAASGGSNERLNELCLEAMAYEYSKEGRAARKQQQEARGNEFSLPDVEDTFSPADGRRRGCAFCQRNRLKILRDYVNIEPRDLSQMRDIGKRVGACPFLVTRELLREADVVLIPYSYLVSSEMRAALLSGAVTNEHPTEQASGGGNLATELYSTGGSATNTSYNGGVAGGYSNQRWVIRGGKKTAVLPPDFTGDIIVVDEAHNLVDYCRSVTTAVITHTELLVVRHLLDGYRRRYETRLLTRNKQRLREMISFADKIAGYLQEVGERPLSPTEICSIPSFTFAAGVDTVNVFLFLDFVEESRLFTKLHCLLSHLIATMEEQGQSSAKVGGNLALMGESADVSLKDSDNYKSSSSSDDLLRPVLSMEYNPHSFTSTLHRFEAFLRWYSRADEYTRVVIRRHAPLKDSDEAGKVCLELFQMEPGMHTISPVLQQAQAVVLAGGTMKPLSLTCDLILKPPLTATNAAAREDMHLTDTAGEQSCRRSTKQVRFTEESHVVPSSSIAVFALGKGPSGRAMEFQHAKRHLWPQMFDEVAAALLNFCRIVPAGMIVFFTSYEVEDLFVSTIRRSGMYDAINTVKRIFREPGTSRKAVSTYEGPTEPTEASPTSTVDSMLEDYAAWVRSEGSSGALLLAVIGGKLSEGINFNDDLGRAVVVVGLPFANINEVELQLHLRHIASTRIGDSSLTSGAPTSTASKDATIAESGVSSCFSSTEWGLFTDLCMRAVNQSIGRCIRHAGDYAAVILMDLRYVERRDIRRRIAGWMQPSIQLANNFGECFRGVRDFFATRR
uniref:Putative DNA repair helicase n=1 Tax=Trypanosoma congolense (strain IL3000) TaxID=1068625 RepID=G0UVW9_TRYCI|nr:putative DNA repair helicase [Trypanosoma congolense IL3000]